MAACVMTSDVVWTLTNTGVQVAAVTLANSLTGDSMTIASYIANGSVVVIDGTARSVMIDDMPIPFSSISGDFPQLAAGTNSISWTPDQFTVAWAATQRIL